MAIPVLMPKQGQSVETCIITKWFKRPGDKVSANDLLFSYETDKAAFELESPGDGILLDIFFDEGAEVPVLINVAVIGQPGESIAQFMPGKTTETQTANLTPEKTSPTSSVVSATIINEAVRS
ncbi:MAG: lipoyl domain-containing protein, partial [Bacteroidia bacterium]|nr:lipoyl domain-containing protein [Bacteroidia bacterium]